MQPEKIRKFTLLAIFLTLTFLAVLNFGRSAHSDLYAWMGLTFAVSAWAFWNVYREMGSRARVDAWVRFFDWTLLIQNLGCIAIDAVHGSPLYWGYVTNAVIIAVFILLDRKGPKDREKVSKLLGEKSKALRDKLVSRNAEAEPSSG